MAGPAGSGGTPSVPTVLAADPTDLGRAVHEWRKSIRPGDYAGLQAYLAPTPETRAALTTLRGRIGERHHIATTLGFGPRFLHSTGQLHKGGPPSGLFLQIVDAPKHDLEVPGTDYTFGQLIHAQALGDYQALRQKGRRVLRVDLGTRRSGRVGTTRRGLRWLGSRCCCGMWAASCCPTGGTTPAARPPRSISTWTRRTSSAGTKRSPKGSRPDVWTSTTTSPAPSFKSLARSPRTIFARSCGLDRPRTLSPSCARRPSGRRDGT